MWRRSLRHVPAPKRAGGHVGRLGGPRMEEDSKQDEVEMLGHGGGLRATVRQERQEELPEPQGSRQGSLYEPAAPALEEPEAPLALEGDLEARLRQSRVRWLLVRWSHETQSFQADPEGHYVRLISWFRLSQALVDHFPVEVLRQLLRPLLSPAYRCATAFKALSLPDVTSLEQALELSPAQRRSFLAQLAQQVLESLESRLPSDVARVLNEIRKLVESKRWGVTGGSWA